MYVADPLSVATPWKTCSANASCTRVTYVSPSCHVTTYIVSRCDGAFSMPVRQIFVPLDKGSFLSVIVCKARCLGNTTGMAGWLYRGSASEAREGARDGDHRVCRRHEGVSGGQRTCGQPCEL